MLAGVYAVSKNTYTVLAQKEKKNHSAEYVISYPLGASAYHGRQERFPE